MKGRAILFLSLILLVACATPAQKNTNKNKNQPPSTTQNTGQSAGQITEITLERTACFGACPMYKVTLRSDGTATYKGEQYVERKGTYNGTFHGFHRLVQLIEKQGYFNLKDEYTIEATDMPSAITSVVRAGKRKTITHYGDSGPVELWAIEQAIDGVVANARWDKSQK
jgi:hypothetical protein